MVKLLSKDGIAKGLNLYPKAGNSIKLLSYSEDKKDCCCGCQNYPCEWRIVEVSYPTTYRRGIIYNTTDVQGRTPGQLLGLSWDLCRFTPPYVWPYPGYMELQVLCNDPNETRICGRHGVGGYAYLTDDEWEEQQAKGNVYTLDSWIVHAEQSRYENTHYFTTYPNPCCQDIVKFLFCDVNEP